MLRFARQESLDSPPNSKASRKSSAGDGLLARGNLRRNRDGDTKTAMRPLPYLAGLRRNSVPKGRRKSLSLTPNGG